MIDGGCLVSVEGGYPLLVIQSVLDCVGKGYIERACEKRTKDQLGASASAQIGT